METKAKRRPKGSQTVRQERRGDKNVWGYHVWIRQPDGSRKQHREFSFKTKAEAQQALAALRTAGWKTRYAVNPPAKEVPTTIKEAAADYQDLAEAKLITHRTEDTTYWRDHPGHLHTLNRFVTWAGEERHITHVTEINKDVITYWIAAETKRAQKKGTTLKQATIKRGLNTILAALHHAVESGKFKDLLNYRVPKNPLKKYQVEEDRDRVLTDEEIEHISTKLADHPEYEEALFFFQLALITGARMAELRRMKWDESSVRFGTVKLKSTKTGGKVRTIKAPAAAELIAQRREAKLGGPIRVLTQDDKWFRDAFKEISESLNILYGQRIPGGWTIHDLRHTCLSNLALEGMPLHAIKEYAGHKNITETQRYLKYMPQQIELGAKVTTKLAVLANAKPKSHTHAGANEIECPNCGFAFSTTKSKHLQLVTKTS